MLDAGRDSPVMQAIDKSADHLPAEERICSERPVADRLIVGIDQHVSVRGKIQVDPQLMQVSADRTACLKSRRRIAGCPDFTHRSHIGHTDSAVFNARDQAAFLIRSQENRDMDRPDFVFALFGSSVLFTI